MALNLAAFNDLIAAEEASGRQIIFIDASSLKDTGCLRKFYWSCIRGYKQAEETRGYDLKMEYGTAYHLFLQHWYLGKSLQDCVSAAAIYYDKILSLVGTVALESEYEFRTMSHLLLALKKYAEYYPRGPQDGLIATATEQKFAFPYWRNDKFTIFLAGTIDLVGSYHGIPVVADHKTTASYIIKNYFDQYELNIQTIFYSWIWNHLNGGEGDKFRAALINGIFIKKPTQIASKKGEFDGVKFERSKPFEYTAEQMTQFKLWFDSKLEIIKGWCNGTRFLQDEFELAFCKTPFGLCKFFHVCKSPPSSQQMILNNSFVATRYNPLTFGGVD